MAFLFQIRLWFVYVYAYAVCTLIYNVSIALVEKLDQANENAVYVNEEKYEVKVQEREMKAIYWPEDPCPVVKW